MPAGASRLALTLNGTESEEQLAQVNSVDAVVALLDIQVGVQHQVGVGGQGWGGAVRVQLRGGRRGCMFQHFHNLLSKLMKGLTKGQEDVIVPAAAWSKHH